MAQLGNVNRSDQTQVEKIPVIPVPEFGKNLRKGKGMRYSGVK